MKDCLGLPKDFDESSAKPIEGNTSFIWIRLSVLREYLARELRLENLPFDYTVERAIDDWVGQRPCTVGGTEGIAHFEGPVDFMAIDALLPIY